MDKHRIKRPDVVLRRETNKSINFSIIKTTWKAFCKDDTFVTFPLEKILRNINKATYEAYKLANLHITRLLYEGEICILDKKFFYNCLVGVSKNYDRKTKRMTNEKLIQTINLYDSYKPTDYKSANSSYLCTYFDDVADQMMTNCHNSFKANFYNRFKKYVKTRNLWNNNETYWFLQDVYDQKYNGYDPQVWKYKDLLNYEYPASENVLLLSYKILKFFEDRCEKVFNLIPNSNSFTTNYIKISNISLYSTLVQNGYIKKGVSRKDFMNSKDEYWRKLFHIDKYETCNRKFHFEIMTDGKAVSILQCKVKSNKECTDKKINIEEYDTIWGLDPGRKDIYAATNLEGDTIKCSSREFYNDAKFTYSKNKIESWYKSNDKVSQILKNIPSVKTTSLTKWENFLKYIFVRIDVLFDFHRDKAFRNIKFTRFIASKKKITELCKKIAVSGKRTLVGFGDWSNNDKIIKGHPKGPVKKLKYELSKHCKVIDVDEYLSSKLCHNCGYELSKQKWNRYDVFGCVVAQGTVHHSLRCNNVSCKKRGMNRDTNASLNILHIFYDLLTTGKRPDIFKRE